jgi:hypothetical protein
LKAKLHYEATAMAGNEEAAARSLRFISSISYSSSLLCFLISPNFPCIFQTLLSVSNEINPL